MNVINWELINIMNYNIKVYQLNYNDSKCRKIINSRIDKKLIASYISTKEKLSQDYIKIFNRYKHIKNIHIEF